MVDNIVKGFWSKKLQCISTLDLSNRVVIWQSQPKTLNSMHMKKKGKKHPLSLSLSLSLSPSRSFETRSFSTQLRSRADERIRRFPLCVSLFSRHSFCCDFCFTSQKKVRGGRTVLLFILKNCWIVILFPFQVIPAKINLISWRSLAIDFRICLIIVLKASD